MAGNDAALYDVAATVFESMAMLFATPELDAEQRATPATSGVFVTFRGPRCGRLELRVSPALLPIITSNMLGDDGPHPARAQHDALGELANVICGNALPTIAGSDAVFDLERPHPLTPAAGSPALPPRAHVELWLEDGRADVALYVEPDAPR